MFWKKGKFIVGRASVACVVSHRCPMFLASCRNTVGGCWFFQILVNCRNRSSKESCKKSFRHFPANKEHTEKWIAAVNRKNWSPTKYSRVCNDHFVTGK